MKIFLILFVLVIVLLIIGKDVLFSAKRNLFKDQAAWSGKDIKIKYSSSRKLSESKGKDNYLKIIADESKTYLEDESKKKEE